jgi:hypothetical protein
MVRITEGIFIRAFSSFELFLEELFVLYALGKPSISGTKVNRFILPRDGRHVRELIRADKQFVDWASADLVLQRVETYFDGGPMKTAIVQYKDRLKTVRRIRNAIAHRSDEAWGRYVKVVAAELRAPPLKIPQPGEFLMMTDPRVRTRHFLLTYFDVFREFAEISAA